MFYRLRAEGLSPAAQIFSRLGARLDNAFSHATTALDSGTLLSLSARILLTMTLDEARQLVIDGINYAAYHGKRTSSLHGL